MTVISRTRGIFGFVRVYANVIPVKLTPFHIVQLRGCGYVSLSIQTNTRICTCIGVLVKGSNILYTPKIIYIYICISLDSVDTESTIFENCQFLTYAFIRSSYFGLSSSLSCRVASMDIPDPLSPLLSIIHRSGRSSGLHPVSYSCCMYVRAGLPAFAWPWWEG